MRNQVLLEKYQQGRHWNDHPTIYAERFAKYLRMVDFRGVVVDLGCGCGRDTMCFCAQGFKAIGIDKSSEALRLAQENCDEPDIFVAQNVENLGISRNCLEAVFAINLVHYVDEKMFLSEVHRVLNKNGYFFIHFNLLIMDSDGNVDLKDSRSEILARLSKAGFVLISTREFTRIDHEPVRHTHIVLELILQKW